MKILKILVAFFILNSSFLISSHAQIVYTDIIPDTVVHHSYSIDVNNDGIYDFTLNAGKSGIGYGTHLYVSISGLNDNEIEVAGSLSLFPGYPLALSKNTIITGQEAFVGYAYLRSGRPSYSQGYWENNKTRYLGIKLIKNGLSFYGWIKLSVLANSWNPSATLKSYAYNPIPNQPILAGETSCTTPTVNLSASGPLSFCAGDSVTLTASGTGYLYQWKKNNVNISGATSQTYIAKTAGIYKCKVTNSCGSITSGTRTVTVPCRDGDASFMSMTSAELEHISVYPNPAINSVTIKFPSDEEENTEPAEVQIVNLFGQIVFSEKIITEQSTNLPACRQVDVSKFSAGMYVVRWNSGENNETKTFSVIK